MPDGNSLYLHYPPRDHQPDGDALATFVAEIEEGWAAPPVADWPVAIAAKICPVFRFLTGAGR